MSKKSYPFYQVDAFTKQIFGGNPAAVIILDYWLEDSVLQQIAAENNLSETAFLVQLEDGFFIRWFTPNKEVDLCGHATLASAFVLFTEQRIKAESIRLETKGAGPLIVSCDAEGIVLDFPLIATQLVEGDEEVQKRIPHIQALEANNLILELESEKAVQQFIPDQDFIRQIHPEGVAITAKASTEGFDFVSRYFAPNFAIDEDPVTGSLHCELAHYWQQKLNKNSFKALQLSERRGELLVEVKENRVLLKGKAKLVIKGMFSLS